MSLRASTWALYEAPKDIDAIEFRILMIIADNCDDNGKGFAFSVQKLADLASISKRTAQLRLQSLKKRGLIVDGNQRLVSYLPSNKRPNVYNLDMTIIEKHHVQANTHNAAAEFLDTHTNPDDIENGGAESAPPKHNPDSLGCSRGAVGVQLGCSWGAHMHAPDPIETIETNKPREYALAKNAKIPISEFSYTPQDDDQATRLAREAHVDVCDAYKKFKNYYSARNTKRVDWQAQFHLWLRREKLYTHTSHQTQALTPEENYYNPTGLFNDTARSLLDNHPENISIDHKSQLLKAVTRQVIDLQGEKNINERVTEYITSELSALRKESK